MSVTTVVYFAHPLGGDVDGNAARARKWLRWLMDQHPGVAFCCPWLPFVDVGRPDEKTGPGAVDPDSLPEYRARCLRDDIAIAARCDGIVLCGARISPGMRMELEAIDGWVSDLTGLNESIRDHDRWSADPPLEFGRRMWARR